MILFKKYTPLVFLLWLSASCTPKEQQSSHLVELDSKSSGFYSEQIAFVSQLIEEDKGNANHYYMRSRLYAANKQYEQALDDATASTRLDSLEGKFYLQKANIAMELGLTQEALTAGNRAQSLGVEDVSLYNLAGLSLTLDEKYEEALEYLQKAEAILPDNASTLYNMGRVYLAQHKYSVAEKYLKRSIAQNNRAAAPYVELMALYSQQSAPLKALETGEAALTNCLPSAPVYGRMGQALSMLNQTDSAMQWYAKSLELDQNNWEITQQLGAYHIKQRHPELAEKHYRKFMEQNPAHATALYQLGYIYERWYRQYPDALELYQQSYEQDSTNQVNANAILRVERAIRWQQYLKEHPEVVEQMRKEKEQQERLKQRLSTPAEKETIQK